MILITQSILLSTYPGYRTPRRQLLKMLAPFLTWEKIQFRMTSVNISCALDLEQIVKFKPEFTVRGVATRRCPFRVNTRNTEFCFQIRQKW